jgi:hypothetical protein
MDIITLVVYFLSFSLTAGLAIWSVVRGERDKKANKLFESLLSEFKASSDDEIKKLILSESSKTKVNKILILSLEKILKYRDDRKIYEESKSQLKHFVNQVAIAIFYAVVLSCIAALILFSLTLITPIVQFNWVFICIVFAIVFVISAFTSHS